VIAFYAFSVPSVVALFRGNDASFIVVRLLALPGRATAPVFAVRKESACPVRASIALWCAAMLQEGLP